MAVCIWATRASATTRCVRCATPTHTTLAMLVRGTPHLLLLNFAGLVHCGVVLACHVASGEHYCRDSQNGGGHWQSGQVSVACCAISTHTHACNMQSPSKFNQLRVMCLIVCSPCVPNPLHYAPAANWVSLRALPTGRSDFLHCTSCSLTQVTYWMRSENTCVYCGGHCMW